VPPPKRPLTPPFTCNTDWIEAEIFARLDGKDSPDGSERVSPMAVVRCTCSRGGKTRALIEIASIVHGRSRELGHDPVAVIFVSFQDFSSLAPYEQKEPLKALFQRIAFSALRRQPDDSRSEAQAFWEFIFKDYDIQSCHILDWLDGYHIPAILIVDELNNLSELTKWHSVDALEKSLTWLLSCSRTLEYPCCQCCCCCCY
jgi:hypothetical protein